MRNISGYYLEEKAKSLPSSLENDRKINLNIPTSLFR